MNAAINGTLEYLRACQTARAGGYPVAYTTDPAWLVHVALNRRAGWPDDPGGFRGSARPIDGRFPRKAGGTYYQGLRTAAHRINTPRRIVRLPELGEHRWLTRRLPDRFTED